MKLPLAWKMDYHHHGTTNLPLALDTYLSLHLYGFQLRARNALGTSAQPFVFYGMQYET